MSLEYSQIVLLGTIAQDIIGIICIIYLHTFNSHSKIINIFYAHCVLIFVTGLIFYFHKNIKQIITNLSTEMSLQDTSTFFICLMFITHYVSNFCVYFGISKEIIFLLTGIFFKNIINENIESVISVQNIFLAAIFFVSGYNIDIITAIISIYQVLVILLYISLIKFILYYSVIYFIKKDIETSILSATLLSSFSEIIFFLLFLLNMDKQKSTIINMASIASIFIIPIVFKKFEHLFNTNRIRTFGVARKAARHYVAHINTYNLIIGINKISICMAQKLGEELDATILIDKNMEKINQYKNDNFLYLDAMTKETYTTLNLDKIKRIIICIQKIEIVEKIVTLLRNIDNNIRIIHLSYQMPNSITLIKYRITTRVVKSVELEDQIEDVIKEFTVN